MGKKKQQSRPMTKTSSHRHHTTHDGIRFTETQVTTTHDDGQVEARSCIDQEYVPDDLAADLARVEEQYASNEPPKPGSKSKWKIRTVDGRKVKVTVTTITDEDGHQTSETHSEDMGPAAAKAKRSRKTTTKTLADGKKVKIIETTTTHPDGTKTVDTVTEEC